MQRVWAGGHAASVERTERLALAVIVLLPKHVPAEERKVVYRGAVTPFGADNRGEETRSKSSPSRKRIRFGVHAVVLMGDAHGQSKMEEQVMSRRSDQPLAFHKEFVKALYELYWDIDADTLKSGARGEGPGSVMHMIDLLTQFDLTFDIASLDAPLLLQLLPKDFKRFTSPATRQSARPSRNAQKVDESAISPQ